MGKNTMSNILNGMIGNFGNDQILFMVNDLCAEGTAHIIDTNRLLGEGLAGINISKAMGRPRFVCVANNEKELEIARNKIMEADK
jgi:hypothetical protein